MVSIPLQRAYVYRGGALIGVTTVSTGKPGHRTPTGKFDILQKRAKHFSNLYNNAPMPFMQRLTWGGIALHAGQIPGRPASHGCVRLPLDFARNLFGVTSDGRLGAHRRPVAGARGSAGHGPRQRRLYRHGRAAGARRRHRLKPKPAPLQRRRPTGLETPSWSWMVHPSPSLETRTTR